MEEESRRKHVAETSVEQGELPTPRVKAHKETEQLLTVSNTEKILAAATRNITHTGYPTAGFPDYSKVTALGG